jgi:transcriptional regulator with XRE-family HTH domain
MNYLRIKELLKEQGVTAKHLADKIGISENGLSLIISGKRQPRFELLNSIAIELDVPFWQLFSEPTDSFNGYVEYKGKIHKIKSKQDIENLLNESNNYN